MQMIKKNGLGSGPGPSSSATLPSSSGGGGGAGGGSSAATERASYHGSSSAASGYTQERKCDSCGYKVAINECQQFKCKDCGTYIICDYCYEEYMEANDDYYDAAYGHETSSSHHHSSSLDPNHKKKGNGVLQQMQQLFRSKQFKFRGPYQKLKCVYCSSKHSLNDITVKTLKSFGFVPPKGTNKIPISSLSKEKIKKLGNLRVIQKTLVYVIGLAPEIASEDILKSAEYFGQYGDLTKVVVNTNNVYNATKGGPSYSAYLTYSHPRESAIAILAVDQYLLMDRMLRASFGTSKFCQFFMNGQKCTNKDCLYLHEIRTDLEAYTKEDMQNNKFIFQEQQKIAIKLSRALEMSLDEFKLYNKQNHKNYPTDPSFKPELPSADTIYIKDFHFLDEPLINRRYPTSSSSLKNGNSSASSSSVPASKSGSTVENVTSKISEKDPFLGLPSGTTLTLEKSASLPQKEISSMLSSSQTAPAAQSSSTTAKQSQQKDTPTVTQSNMMTLSNQRDENNQSERQRSKDRLKTQQSQKDQQEEKKSKLPHPSNIEQQKAESISKPEEIKTKSQVAEGFGSKEESKQEVMMQKDQDLDEDQLMSQRQIKVIEEMIADEDDHKPLPFRSSLQEKLIESPKEISNGGRKLSAQLENNSVKAGLESQPNNQDSQSLNITANGKGAVKKSEGFSTLSKTPPHHQHANEKDGSCASANNTQVMQIAQLLSPMIFPKKQQSRFQFAQSVDPIKQVGNFFDWDEIEVPAKIQDLIERNIRTLSNNSLQNKSVPNNVPIAAAAAIQTSPNGQVQMAGQEIFDLKDMKEKWLTKKEMMQQKDSDGGSPTGNRRLADESNSQANASNTLLKFKPKSQIQGQQQLSSSTAAGQLSSSQQQIINGPPQQQQASTNPGGPAGYNLTEHSVNIRVKYNNGTSSRLSTGRDEDFMNGGSPNVSTQSTVTSSQQQQQTFQPSQQSSYQQMQYVPVNQQMKVQYKPAVSGGGSNLGTSSYSSSSKQNVMPSSSTTAASFINSSTNKQRRRKEDKRADRQQFGSYQ